MTSPELWAPYVRIVTPQVFFPFFVTDFVLHSEEGQHQWAQLTVRYHIPSTMRPVLSELPAELWWQENKPVRITYGTRRSVAKEFVGYVVSPEVLLANDRPPMPHIPGQMIDVRYTLLGPTKPLQTVKNTAWVTCQAAYIAREIAERNGLTMVAGAHARVFDYRQQTESDFVFLRRMAQEVGWRLVADGTTLYFTDPRTALTSRVPVFRQNGVAGRQDTMQSFTAVTGELDPAGEIRAEHEAVSLSPAGVVMPSVSSVSRSQPAGGEIPAQVLRRTSGYVASSYNEAQSVSAAAARRGLWWVSATATVDGDVDLAPGCVVSLGGEALTAQYTGRWMTRAAHHRISISPTDRRLSSYYVDLTLGRDQADRLTTRKSGPLPRTRNVLAGGHWVSRKVV